MIDKTNIIINKEFKSIIDLLLYFSDDQKCIDYLENIRWGECIESPFDKSSVIYICKSNQYKCKNTGKYFNVKTGTMFEGTKLPLKKWMLAIWLITSHKGGITSVQLGKDIHVTQSTAWLMLHKIRNCFKFNDSEKMTGIVEIDEVFIGGKEKFKHKNKRSLFPQSHSNKIAILGIVERGGRLMAKVVGVPTLKNVTPVILENIAPETTVVTDQAMIYKKLKMYYDHQVVNHEVGEYVVGNAYTNTIEGFWSILRRSTTGMYKKTSREHLPRYVDESVFRYNTKNDTESFRFNLLLSNLDNRMTRKELIN